ncbi:cytochrome-c peroxidase [Blastopirellula sp. JC732]|uniref:Methylamine utilization protein MauG n=1 Tax=Blastopirellula sediminis TaxID=2894196 RepID=A0A9X1MIR7_9BACT|nr:cytochrome-c peroxidase [Blastopirellula sediminis]MCC9609615.1 cytochrome-c peroxidase [Blastopirellula sediminis]MCC9627609.1 cytochrome-c peroxidase [Blastopirellula sediminis]
MVLRSLSLILLLLAPLGRATADDFISEVPLGLDWVRVPDGNPQTAAKVALGRRLFFDPQLSRDKSISCASCHDPEQGWSLSTPVAKGVDGRTGERNPLSIINTGLQHSLFWDGRAKTLEEQALEPIQNRVEMDMDLRELEKRLAADPAYVVQFQESFAGDVTAERVTQAIAAFERTLLAAETPYDLFRNGRATAMDDQMSRGSGVFFSRANCGDCHIAKVLTDHQFHDTGIGASPQKIRTPMLRDLERTAPYMHDGSLTTLRDVVDYYDRGGNRRDGLDVRMRPLGLSKSEKEDLLYFLEAGLRSRNYPGRETDAGMASATNSP